MNCLDWEERIALYIGGDLPPSDNGAVEMHLAECPGCQVFSSGLKRSIELLKEAHEEVPEAAEAAVRARVLSAIERDRVPRMVWRWIVPLAAAAMVLWSIIAVRPARVPNPPAIAIHRPPAPTAVSIPHPVAVRAPVVRTRVVRRRRAVSHERVLVRLVTDNPEVVIYWIAEKRGD